MRMAVIPARGGSKRIARKNIKEFCGKPMIAWAIKAAKETNIFDLIVVSTDDDEIAKIAEELGATVPFKRPSNLSDDYTGTSPVVAHAIEWHLNQGFDIEEVCCIYASSPFTKPDDISIALSALIEHEAEFAFPITSYVYPIQRALLLNNAGCVEMFDQSNFFTRSQDLQEAYHDAGQFYWGRLEAWLSLKPIFGSYSTPVILPRYRVQDIDTYEDWERAELMFKVLANSQQESDLGKP